MEKKWNDSSMLQHMYMNYKGIGNEEILKGYIAKLSLLTPNLGSNFKLGSAIKKYHTSDNYVAVDINLHKDMENVYNFMGLFIDKSTAILLVNDFQFVKLALTCCRTGFIDYIDRDNLIMSSDVKVYVTSWNSKNIVIEVNSNYLIINSSIKVAFESMDLIYKWMIQQLQRGSVYTSDILLPNGQFVKYLVKKIVLQNPEFLHYYIN